MNRSVAPVAAASKGALPVRTGWRGRFALGAFFLALVPVEADESPSDVLVVADVTAAGKAAPQGSPERPVYYEAVWAGFRELGAVVAGEKAPPVEPAKKSLVEALRRLGYIPADANTPPATIMIFFAWGTLNPDIVTTPGSGLEGQDTTTSYNNAQMLAFLGAHKVARSSDLSPERNRVLVASGEEHYFLAVAAYDLESMYQRKRKLLWMTRLATSSRRVWLPSALPAMVARAEPFFGKEAETPVWVDATDRAKGSVRIAPLEVKEYVPEPAKAGEKP